MELRKFKGDTKDYTILQSTLQYCEDDVPEFAE